METAPDRAEVLIVGGGIIGLCIARELARRGRDGIVVLEKEDELGRHASGRNSGVLHAGIYYSPDSMRAKSCISGNRLLKAYCREKGLPLAEPGKVIVARTEKELTVLDELHRRGTANGARVEFVDQKALESIEPAALTVEKALYVRDTAVVDPMAVLKSVRHDLEESGRVRILTGCRFEGLDGPSTARTSRGKITFKRFVNAAGAFCDRVAGAFNVGGEYRLIPFKGI
jgi:(S)-2-hydroxyglutarate dehydrogenase